MARIRTIKPEFWTDEKLSLLDPLTRLVFLGLISMADDAGRLIDNVKLLDGMLFPNTDDTCGPSVETLARLSRITRYRSVSGQSLMQITKWEDHQKVDNPSKYTLPGPDEAAFVQHYAPEEVASERHGVSREPIEGRSRVERSDLGPRTLDLGPTTELPAAPDGACVSEPGTAVVRNRTHATSASANGGTKPVASKPRKLAEIEARISSALAAVAEGTASRITAEEKRRLQAEFVFAYWIRKMNHPRATWIPGDERERKLVRALKDNGGDVSELLYVVDGALRTPYLMGDNAQRQKYDGIETLFRDRAQIEKLAAKCAGYQRGEPHPIAAQLSGEVAA